MIDPKRGEVWLVEFYPSRGAEISKTRPAVVLSIPKGKLPLRIVIPVTDWKTIFGYYDWFAYLEPTKFNGLMKPSGADCFQPKSFALERFIKKLGHIGDE